MSTRFPPRHFIDQVSDLVRVTVREVIDLYRGGHISREDHITGTFVSLLEKNLKDRALEGITINVKAFSLSEEKATGADFGVLLNIDLPHYKLSKVFIAQAKRCSCWGKMLRGYLSKKDSQRLIDQCTRMLKITPSSFVIIYTENFDCGFRLFPAGDVLGLGLEFSCKTLNILKGVRVERLFRQFLECVVGDSRVAKEYWGETGAEELMSKYNIKHLLFMLLRRSKEKQKELL